MVRSVATNGVSGTNVVAEEASKLKLPKLPNRLQMQLNGTTGSTGGDRRKRVLLTLLTALFERYRL